MAQKISKNEKVEKDAQEILRWLVKASLSYRASLKEPKQ